MTTPNNIPPVKKVENTQTPAPVLQPEANQEKGDELFGGAPATPEATAPAAATPAPAPATPAVDPTKVVIPKAEVSEEAAGTETDDDLFGEPEEIDPATVPEIPGVEDIVGSDGKGSMIVGDPHAKEIPESKKGNIVTRESMMKKEMTEAETKVHQEEIDSTLSIQVEIAKKKSAKNPLRVKPRILGGICEFCGRVHASTKNAVIVHHMIKVNLQKEQVPILHVPTCYWAKLNLNLQS